MKSLRLLTLMTLVALCTLPQHAQAWGWEAHRWITAAAVDILPADMRATVMAQRDGIIAHSPDPDLWRDDPLEYSRHFIDLDLADTTGAPYPNIPYTYRLALEKYGVDALQDIGSLPWRIDAYYYDLVAAMEAPTDSLWVIMAALGHYCSDATMPMHTTVNYDGQLTGNRGIHYRFEWWIPEQFADEIRLDPVAPLLVTDRIAAAWRVIYQSNVLVDTLLAADTDVRRTFREPIRNPNDRHGRGRDAEYDALLYDRLGEIITSQLELAAQFTAGIWYAAWLDAGRPDLSDVPAPPEPPSEQ